MLTTRALELKQRLAAGETTCGMWVGLPSPVICEIVAGAGFDWIVVDAEHAPFNPETLMYAAMAFKGCKTVPIVRVPANDETITKLVLDLGWEGIVVPRVDTADEARRAVGACLYPPLGNRGYGPRRASSYYRNADGYVKMANDSVICAIQAESITAVRNIEEIVRVHGISWVIVGPNDLSGTVGVFRDHEDPELLEAISTVLRTAQAAGIPCGNAVAELRESLKMGCQLVFLGEDLNYLREATDEAVADFRQVVAEAST